MIRFYLITIFIFFSFTNFAQGFLFFKEYNTLNTNISNNCLNGGGVTTASVTVSGLDNLSNDLELLFAGADFTIKKGFDLQITVISPQKTRAVFLDTRAGSNFPIQLDRLNLFRARNCDWFLPHTSPQFVNWSAGPLFCFRPVHDFNSRFKGENPNGEWKFEFCSTATSEISLGFLMLEFRTLKSIITAPKITKKPTDCLSADGSIVFDFGSKCDQGFVYYTVDNQPWQSKPIPVDYTLGFVTKISQTITGLKAGKHTIKAMLGSASGVYNNTYNEREFTLEATNANGDIQTVCAGDFTIGNGTTSSVTVKLIPPQHWDNCGFATSITKITGKFTAGDIIVDLNTQTLGITGNGKTEFVWEITNSKGQKKTCSSFVTTVLGNAAVFTADVCKKPVKAPKCDFTKPLTYIPINISQLQKLGTKTILDKVEVTMKFPAKCTGEAYLIDPTGNTYRLFDAFSFPSYNNSGSMTVEFSTSTDPIIKLHNSAILPTSSDKLRQPIGNLNRANLRKINPNGIWNLAVCDNSNAGFDIECVKFHFNDACTKDQETPTFTQCPANRIVTLGADNKASFNITDPFSTDNCKVKQRKQEVTYLDGATAQDGKTYIEYPDVSSDQGKEYGYNVQGKGRIIVKYTTIDEANNAGYCYMYISVVGPNDCANDLVKPILVDCVPDFEITANPGGVTDYLMTDPEYFDNCGIKSIQLKITHLNGAKSINNTTSGTSNTFSPYQTYSYEVIGTGSVNFEYLVTDLKGNVGSCKTLVTIKSPNGGGGGTGPCATLNPILSMVGTNCVNNVMTVNPGTGIGRIDWKNGSQTVSTSTIQMTPSTSGQTFIPDDGKWNPLAMAFDKNGNLYVTDNSLVNPSVLKFAPGATVGTTVAGGNGIGANLNQLNSMRNIHVNDQGDLFICDRGNDRVVRWSSGATTGVVVAGGNGKGAASNQFNVPSRMFIDQNGNIFVLDADNFRVQKWSPGAAAGVTVAGTGVDGTAANQISKLARGVSVNPDGEIFVLDSISAQSPKFYGIKKFPANSTQGTNSVIVAKDSSFPWDLTQDAIGNFYITSFDHVVKRFPHNSTESTAATIVAGGNGNGAGLNQLDSPRGMTIDGQFNIYISEQGGNYRVSKWAQTLGTLPLTYTPITPGTYSADVYYTNGCKKATSSIPVVECNTPDAPTAGMTPSCIAPGQTIVLPFTVGNFKNMSGFQFELVLPAGSNLKFERIENLGTPGVQFNVLPNGNMVVIWDEPNGNALTLANGFRIFDVVLTATGSFNASATITGKDVSFFLAPDQKEVSGTITATVICLTSKVNLSGTIKTPLDKGVNNVKIDLVNGTAVEKSSTTDATGAYKIDQASPSTKVVPSRTDDPSAGINVADAARIRRHILQSSLLDSDYKKFAADVDKNGKIDVADVAVVNRIILKKISVFPNSVPSWRFIPSGLNISANPNDVNIPGFIDWTSGNATNLNFVGIKVGDVDHSASVQSDGLKLRSAATVLSIPDTTAMPGQTIVVPVRVSGGDPISIFSVNLLFDTLKIKLTKVESSLLTGFSAGSFNIIGNRVIIAWDHPQGASVTGTGQILKLTFNVVGTAGLSNIAMTDLTILDENFGAIPTILDDGSVTIGTSNTANVENNIKVSTYPNPFIDVLNVEVELDTPEKVNIILTDVAGKIIRSVSSNQVSGSHNIQIKDLDYKGVIFVKVESKNVSKYFKVIKI